MTSQAAGSVWKSSMALKMAEIASRSVPLSSGRQMSKRRMMRSSPLGFLASCSMLSLLERMAADAYFIRLNRTVLPSGIRVAT